MALVVGEAMSDPFDEVDTPQLRAEGKMVGFGARKGRELWVEGDAAAVNGPSRHGLPTLPSGGWRRDVTGVLGGAARIAFHRGRRTAGLVGDFPHSVSQAPASGSLSGKRRPVPVDRAPPQPSDPSPMHHLPNSTKSATSLTILAVLAAIAAPACAQSLLPTQGQVVAKIGDAPIGLAVGETIGTTTPVDTPVIDRNGTLLFRGRLVGAMVGTLNDRALFLGHTSADLRVIARTNDFDVSGTFPNSRMVAVSSTTGLPSGSTIFNSARIGPGGLVMFGTQLYDGGNPGADGLIHTGATVNDTVLYWGTPGALQVLAQRRVTAMPGGAVLNGQWATTSMQFTSLNTSGFAVFPSPLEGGDVVGTTNDTAWIIGLPGLLSYLMREGDAVPAVGGATIANISPVTANIAIMNEASSFLHDEKLLIGSGLPAVTSLDDHVAFITVGGVHNVLWREGDPAVDATGAPISGVTYGPPQSAAIPLLATGFSNTGKAAFSTTLLGAVTTLNDFAIFSGGVGSVKLVAREGDVVPGTGGETFATLNPFGNYSDTAGVVFAATLTAPGMGGVTVLNDSVLCTGKPGNVAVIAREGTPVPGLPGYVIGNIAGGANFSSSQRANDRGQVIFNIPINNGALQPIALFTWDPLHGLQLQLVGGDAFGGGTVNAALAPSPFASGDGNPAGFSENGDFAVAPSLVGGGAFIARGHVGSLNGTPSAVPVVGGTPHNMKLDVTPTYGNQFYFILATGLGTDVGFPHPLNFGITVPIDYDGVWTSVSQAWVNTALWTNTLFVTDVNGVGVLPISFNMPPGFPGFLGTTLKHSALLFDGALVGTFATEPTTCYLY